MILVHYANGRRRIDHWNFLADNFPDQPLIPEEAADGQRRKVFIVDATRKSEVVDPIWSALAAALLHAWTKVGFANSVK
jgi:hypothetical protein